MPPRVRGNVFSVLWKWKKFMGKIWNIQRNIFILDNFVINSQVLVRNHSQLIRCSECFIYLWILFLLHETSETVPSQRYFVFTHGKKFTRFRKTVDLVFFRLLLPRDHFQEIWYTCILLSLSTWFNLRINYTEKRDARKLKKGFDKWNEYAILCTFRTKPFFYLLYK